MQVGLAESNGEAKKLIAQGAISVNEQKASDIAQTFSKADAVNGVLLVKRGKKFAIGQF